MNIIKYIIIIFIILPALSCDKHSVIDFDTTKSLKIKGRVINRGTKNGVAGATVRFYSIFRPAETIVITDNNGFYEMHTFKVFCSEFVVFPDDLDPSWRPNDRYFISATKAGFDTLTSGAFFADIHCFDVEQIVNMSIIHLNYREESNLMSGITLKKSE